MTNKYKFSIIIPIYNSEKYLEECINSVIKQKVNFTRDIQIVLINDGSIDNSKEICFKYKQKYPNNIIYLEQENSGVSIARNNGLKHASGEYITFLDSDDKLENKYLKKGYKMLCKNPNVNIVFYRIKFFDSKNNFHPLDYKFQNGDRIVDLMKEYTNIQLSSCSTLIRKTALNNRKFSMKLKIAEDARLITEIVLDNMKVGIISSSKYLYRKAHQSVSAMHNLYQKKTWYLDSMEFCHKYIFELSIKKYNRVIPYVQYLVLYDLQWRLFHKVDDGVLSEIEKDKYLNMIKYLLKNIDDQVIEKSTFYDKYKKLYIYLYKYNNRINDKINFEQYEIMVDNVIIDKNYVSFYCSTLDYKNLNKDIYIIDNTNKKYKVQEYELDSFNKSIICVNEKYSYKKKGLFIKIDISRCKEFYFATIENSKLIKLNVSFNKKSLFYIDYIPIYLNCINKYMIFNNGSFYINNNLFNKIKYKFKIILKLLRDRKLKILIIRVLSKIYSLLLKNNELWIVSDRLNVAGDNGEAFFDYLISNNKGPKRKYFLISSKSHIYKNLKEKYGKNLLLCDSFKYKVLFLNSTKIISAQADEYVTNPFGNNGMYVRDLFKYKFVFLQHGITKDDLSSWLNINNKTIDMFITAGKSEKQSILNFKYNYDKNVVKLTGFARYDLLNNNEKKKVILLMPTWRKNLVDKIDTKTGLRVYDDKFKNTDYFKFYNSLLNNVELINVLKKYNYKIRFIPHINMYQQIGDFTANEYVDIVKNDVVYKDEFNNSSLLITDFSSVFFDFSYLRKPIIYTQFDKKTFFNSQIYDKGYYDYKKNGFGPVCDTIDDTINCIIKYIKNDCNMEKKYLNRINDFFEYNDNKNCERIYKEIKKL